MSVGPVVAGHASSASKGVEKTLGAAGSGLVRTAGHLVPLHILEDLGALVAVCVLGGLVMIRRYLKRGPVRQ